MNISNPALKILPISLLRLVLKTIAVRDPGKMLTPRARFGQALTLHSLIRSLRFMCAFSLAATFRRLADATWSKSQPERFFNRNFLRHILYHPAAFQVIFLS
jgi:hypothetical protein